MRIYIAGIRGMVGSAISREAQLQGHEVFGKPSRLLDLRDRDAVFFELKTMSPDVLIISAAKVGGILDNSQFPVEFLTENLQIQTNLLDGAHKAGIEKVVFLGSSCIYPKYTEQPIRESSLLTGALEPTNEPYAIAKIAGLKLVEAYRKQYAHNWISIMPTNLYGPNDNFNLGRAHVLPALLKRFHIAKVKNLPKVEVWGDGTPLREFLHVSDFAKACMLLLQKYNEDTPINVGSGEEISIRNLALMIAGTIDFSGEIEFNSNKPNGTPRKLLDSSKLSAIGWRPQVLLTDGIKSTYDWFQSQIAEELHS
jgi:GDP-L-fucose synthase